MGTPTAALLPERPLLLTEAQAANLIGLPVKAFKACRLPSQKVAGEVRWLRSDLEQFVQALGTQKRKPPR